MTQPSQAQGKPSLFDRFANKAAALVSHAGFFAFCVLMVIVWFPTLFLMALDMSQLIINTVTTIITFLLVALLENTSKRGGDATQHKLNAIALYLLKTNGGDEEVNAELEAAIGLEDRESTKK